MNECGDEMVKDIYLKEEYRARLIERRETRRHQSLEKSMEYGFDVAGEEDVEEEALRNCEADSIHKAMEKLSPQQKWLIGQIYYESRTRTEIAAELGVGESAIRNRLKKFTKN